MGRRDHSISFLPLFVLAQPTSLMNPTGRNPPPLQFQKAFGRNSNIRFRAECRPLSTLRPICILLRPAVADHRLIAYSWFYRFVRFFFFSLYILFESKEMRYICKKKKFSSLKFKICKIFRVTIDGIIKNCRKSKQKKNSRAKSLKFSNYLKSRLTRNYYKFRIIYRNNGSRIGLNTNMFNLSPSIPFSTLLTLSL